MNPIKLCPKPNNLCKIKMLGNHFSNMFMNKNYAMPMCLAQNIQALQNDFSLNLALQTKKLLDFINNRVNSKFITDD